MNHREVAYGLLRVTMGVIFFFYGIGKFIGGLTNFVGGMNQRFAGKLPAAMVMPFAYVLPFGEVTAGTLILLGFYTRVGLTISGLLLIALTFGTVMLGDAPTVAHNLQYALVNFVLLWLIELNSYSLDAVLFKGTRAGFVPT